MIQNASIELERHKPLAIVRLNNLKSAVEITRALLAGGITTVEFALTNAHALEAIAQVREALANKAIVGVGTVLTGESARHSIEAGAQFLVTPIFLPDVIQVGRAHNVPVVCGAFSPTEIYAAWKAGADLIKVFPAGTLGPAYIHDLLGPLPDLRLVPTGGINLNNCAEFLAAGAYSVGIGSNLVSEATVNQKDWATLTTRAQHYMQIFTAHTA